MSFMPPPGSHGDFQKPSIEQGGNNDWGSDWNTPQHGHIGRPGQGTGPVSGQNPSTGGPADGGIPFSAPSDFTQVNSSSLVIDSGPPSSAPLADYSDGDRSDWGGAPGGTYIGNGGYGNSGGKYDHHYNYGRGGGSSGGDWGDSDGNSGGRGGWRDGNLGGGGSNGNSYGGGGGGGYGNRRPGDWDCPSCGALCFGSKDACYRCGYRRESVGGGNYGFESGSRGYSGGGSSRRRPGDWDCRNCGALVFGSKSNCYRCGAPREDGGGREGGGYGGGSGKYSSRRPGDWDCPSCGALCFGSKDACYRCGFRREGNNGGGGSRSYDAERW